MAKQTIKLKKYADIIVEYPAGGEITPGQLIAVTSTGTVTAQNTAAGICQKMFALEDELQGRTIDDKYEQGDPVQCWVAIPGEHVYAWLADGEDVDEGDLLIAAGGGELKEAGTGSAGDNVFQYPIAVALEAVDMSGSSGEDPSGRIRVRIL